MRTRTWLVALAAGCLLVGWGVASGAQNDGRDACGESCHQQERTCIERCGEHDDPIECEGGCRDQLDDCLGRCR